MSVAKKLVGKGKAKAKSAEKQGSDVKGAAKEKLMEVRVATKREIDMVKDQLAKQLDVRTIPVASFKTVFDVNNDGVVSLDEFTKVILSLLSERQQKKKKRRRR